MTIIAWVLLTPTIGLMLGALIERLCEARDARLYPPPGEMVQIGDGRQLHIRRAGAADGPTVVFEMGVLEPSAFWWDVQDAVAAFARTVTYDRAGYGWSPPERRRHSMEDRAADLAALLDSAGVRGPLVLVGHSYGGALIRLFARRNPTAAAGFVFVDAAAEESLFDTRFLAFARRKVIPIMRVFRFAARCGLARLIRADAMAPPSMSARARAALNGGRGPCFFAAAIDEYRSMADAARTLATSGFGGDCEKRPVAVITHGIPFPPPNDMLEEHWDASQAHLASLSGDSEMIVASNSGHMVHFDEPELLIETVRRIHAAVRDGKSFRTVGSVPAPHRSSAGKGPVERPGKARLVA